MGEKFMTTIFQAEGMNATGIRVPDEVIAALGKGKRPAVKVSLNGYEYRSTVAAYGDAFLLSVSQEHRAASGLKAGDEVEVILEFDAEPRIVAIPADLAAALEAKPGLTAAFEKSSPSARKEFVRQVEDAKTQETRDRRIAAIVTKLS